MCFARCENAIFSEDINNYRVNKILLNAVKTMAFETEDPTRDKKIRIACCPNTIDMEKF